MSERHTIYLPPSRFVSGSFTEKRTLDKDRRPIPEDKQSFEFGFALRKDSPDAPAFFGQLINAAKACYPNNAHVHGQIDQWLTSGMNGFSMKVSDGDKPSMTTGKQNENTVGCYMIYCATNYPPTITNEQNAQIDPNLVPRGYYVDATLSLVPNNLGAPNTGVFMNPDMVRWRGVGEIIRGGIDTAAVGASMPMSALPAGAAPVGSAPLGGPPMPLRDRSSMHLSLNRHRRSNRSYRACHLNRHLHRSNRSYRACHLNRHRWETCQCRPRGGLHPLLILGQHRHLILACCPNQIGAALAVAP